MAPLISANTARIVKQLRAQAQATKQMRFWDDTFVVTRAVQPTGWNTGAEGEQVSTVASGNGKLYQSGAGSTGTTGTTSLAGGFIVRLTPYRFQCGREHDIHKGDEITINGDRSFLVQDATRGDGDDMHQDLSLTEVKSGG